MPAISLEERGKINHKLKKLGFGGLDDPNTFAQIATLYRTHDAFRGLLMSTAPDQRRIAYEALKPHLCFRPKELGEYERETKERAEREQWDVYDGTAYPKPFKVAEIESEEYKLAKTAEKFIAQAEAESAAKGHLTLECSKCTFVEKFPGTTRVDASIRARQAGWLLVPRAICPKCSQMYLKVQ